jgi:hypothetical protein
MKHFVFVAVCCVLLAACNNEKTADATTAGSSSTTTVDKDKKAQAEFADQKYAEWGKKMLDQMASGDMDGWMNGFADNAVYQWSSGDSLAGKAAIATYWKDRRTNVIESISFTNDIWLPIKVNTPQKGPDMPGNWLLSWYQVTVKYKAAAKPLTFWIHTDHHFDANDKIDRTIQYMDRAPINAALGK